MAVHPGYNQIGPLRFRRLRPGDGSRVLALCVAAACLAGCGGGGGVHKANAATGAAQRTAAPTSTRPVVPPILDLNGTKPQARAGAEGVWPTWPSLLTTGVPKGKQLKKAGAITVRTDGAVIDGVQANTEINVQANNVTIRDTHLGGDGQWGIIQRQGFSGLRVENTEINGDGVHKVQYGILNQGGMITVSRVYIHTVSDGIQTDQGLIQDSLIMGLKEFPQDHVDGIQSDGGPNPGQKLVIRHNVVLNPVSQTSAIAIFQDFGRAHDVTVDQNLLAGGGYALYGGKGQYGTSSNIKITRNVFSKVLFRNAGAFGPVTAFEQGPGNVWSGNVWADTGKPVSP